jgi:hypothetical protein
MKSRIRKVAGTAFLLASASGLLMAQDYNRGNLDNGGNWGNWGDPRFCAPEIDAASASTALALLGGVVLMIRSRKK